MDDPMLLKQQEEERLDRDIEAKRKEIERETKNVALVKDEAKKVIQHIGELIDKAHEEYMETLRKLGKAQKFENIK